MEQRAARISLALTALSAALLGVGVYFSLEPGWRVLRILGFSLGGMVALPTFALCMYYVYFRRVRNIPVRVAAVASALYGALFMFVLTAAVTNNAVALKWAAYAF
jgi:hypothetical protein